MSKLAEAMVIGFFGGAIAAIGWKLIAPMFSDKDKLSPEEQQAWDYLVMNSKTVSSSK